VQLQKPVRQGARGRGKGRNSEKRRGTYGKSTLHIARSKGELTPDGCCQSPSREGVFEPAGKKRSAKKGWKECSRDKGQKKKKKGLTREKRPKIVKPELNVSLQTQEREYALLGIQRPARK